MKGGATWTAVAAFYERMYGVHSLEESAARIVGAGMEQPIDHALVLLAHNGPSGTHRRLA